MSISRRPSRRSSPRASTPWGTRNAGSSTRPRSSGSASPSKRVVHLVPEDAAPAVLSRLASLTTKQFVRPTVADEESLPVRPRGHQGRGVPKSAQAHPRRACTNSFVEWAEPINRERGREIEFEEILGYHLEQAYRYRTELGAIDGRAMEVGRRGAAKLSSAGRRALTHGDMPTAASLLRRSVELLSPEDPHRHRGAARPRRVPVLRSSVKPSWPRRPPGRPWTQRGASAMLGWSHGPRSR